VVSLVSSALSARKASGDFAAPVRLLNRCVRAVDIAAALGLREQYSPVRAPLSSLASEGPAALRAFAARVLGGSNRHAIGASAAFSEIKGQQMQEFPLRQSEEIS